MKYLNIQDEINYYKKVYGVKKQIEEVFLDKDYTEIQLSTIENIEVKKELYDKAKMDSMVKVVNKNSDLLTLRIDNTTGILKKIIPKIREDEMIKLFYDSKVFRKDSSSNIKEMRQLGVECIGGGVDSDKEVVSMTLDILDKFNGDFILEISSSKYIIGLLEATKFKEEDASKLKELLYTKNRFELRDFLSKKNIEDGIKENLEKLLELQGRFEDVISDARKICINKKMEEALDELQELNKYINNLGYEKYIQYDFSMIMEFSYYDGLIFKGYYPNHYKDIICGGRYNGFTEKFGNKVSAIGFSLDIDELTEIV